MGAVTTDQSRACQIRKGHSDWTIQLQADRVSQIAANPRRLIPSTGGNDFMASNQDTLVTVLGGSGFLGRHVVRALAKREYRIRVAVRRPELTGHLQPLGRVGQIHPVQANLRYPASVEAAMR